MAFLIVFIICIFSAGISTFRNDALVGTGITLSPDGDIFTTGITTSTTFVGNLTGDDKSWLEYNARNLVTLWGPNGEISNYARKQWNGLIKYYYKPQWVLFFNMVHVI